MDARSSNGPKFFGERKKPSSQENNGILVRDTPMRNWRCALEIKSAYGGNCAGIEVLRISTSSMPYSNEIQEINRRINGVAPGRSNQVFIIDLREESHGYLNGEAVTLATDHNWINRDKIELHALEEESEWIHGFGINNEVRVISQAEHKKVIAATVSDTDPDIGSTITVEFAETEKQAVEAAGLIYRRFMVSDHLAPRPDVVDDFIAFYRNLPENAWLHLHCRGGNGRSTTFLTMIDMLNNADKVSSEEIILRQAVLAPHYNLAQVVREVPELTPGYRERYQFLNKFYDFALSLKRGNTHYWSEWCEQKQSAQLSLSQ